jgi:prepilin peptidase CpaA
MPSNVHLANAVLVVTAGVLLYVAAIDLREYKIRNEFILLLFGLFILHTLLLGRWIDAAWNFVLAAIIFGFLVYFYLRQWMGGGDLKILTIAFLWTGLRCALPFAVLLFLSASLHALAAKSGLVPSHQLSNDGPQRIAFAPSVAAAMVIVFILGCLG